MSRGFPIVTNIVFQDHLPTEIIILISVMSSERTVKSPVPRNLNNKQTEQSLSQCCQCMSFSRTSCHQNFPIDLKLYLPEQWLETLSSSRPEHQTCRAVASLGHQ